MFQHQTPAPSGAAAAAGLIPRRGCGADTLSDKIRELHLVASSVPRSASILVPAGDVLDLVNAFWQAVRVAETRRRELAPTPADDDASFLAELKRLRDSMSATRA